MKLTAALAASRSSEQVRRPLPAAASPAPDLVYALFVPHIAAPMALLPAAPLAPHICSAELSAASAAVLPLRCAGAGASNASSASW